MQPQFPSQAIKFTRQTLLLFALLVGTATSAFSAPESGLYFNGRDYAEIPHVEILDGTVEAWIRVDADGLGSGRHRVLGTGTTDTHFNLTVSGDGRLELMEQIPVMNASETTVIVFDFGSAAGEITPGEWHHVAFTQRVETYSADFSNSQMTVDATATLYVDGQMVARKHNVLFGQTTWYVLDHSPLNVGGSLEHLYSLQSFKGEIAQLRLWTTERTQVEIATHMDQSLPADAGDAGLVGLWPMDDPGALPHIANVENSNPSYNHHGTFHTQLDFTTAWEQVEGNALDVGVGADGSVWVTHTPTNGIYRYTGAGWVGMGGHGNRIDAGPNHDACVVVGDGGVWYGNGDVGNWSPLPGEMFAQDVGVGADGIVWATRATDGRIFRHDGSTWLEMGGNGKRIDAGPNGDAYVVTANGTVWYHNGTEDNWVHLPGALANDIGVGADGSVWITYQEDSSIGRWNAAVSIWEETDGHAQQISVGPDGTPYVVQESTQIWSGTPQ
ncbi:MAG: hypothetical protein HN712_22120 [Gemmatimonadetes bacterium]|jgi:hypothetical protein|nr:hypothetical protein [Gemmatimonadota bacterium]MBT6147746.1 hypothetical protein [Gemmatimonadota bacterium]MBT7863026.1 hypothetical protein [Gemmatimonadota bacterium]